MFPLAMPDHRSDDRPVSKGLSTAARKSAQSLPNHPARLDAGRPSLKLLNPAPITPAEAQTLAESFWKQDRPRAWIGNPFFLCAPTGGNSCANLSTGGIVRRG